MSTAAYAYLLPWSSVWLEVTTADAYGFSKKASMPQSAGPDYRAHMSNVLHITTTLY